MSHTPLALIIDDEPNICELLEITLGRMNVNAHSASSINEAKLLLSRHHYDLCLTDMRLPDGNGIELVDHIQKNHYDTPSAVITAHGNVESAVQALKAGAFDFISKPVDLENLRSMVSSALRVQKHSHSDSHSSRQNLPQLLGNSLCMRQTRTTIDKLARSQAPVYISGESGSGKELVARLIHAKGPRYNGPFVPVNCGAIPEHLMESEFFGYRKGSFTGATTDKEGIFQSANGGTLFLDEIADLPAHMQVKLLRAIQEKAIRPLGETKEIPIDVRILSATHKELGQLVAQGEFRQDLYYRINVIELNTPSLRERPEDIPLLCEHFLRKLCLKNYLPEIAISQRALEKLKHYSFPGNVRELENILERAVTLCDQQTVEETDIQLPENPIPTYEPPLEKKGLDPFLDTMEKDAIRRALEKTRYNKTAAAKLLGISFRQLRYRLKKLGIE